MKLRGSIAGSIVLTWGALFLFQCIVIVALLAWLALRVRFALLFLVITLVYHAIFLAVLLSRRDEFQIEPEGIALSRVNIANALTMTRLSSLPTICYLIVLARNPPILVVLLVFVTVVFLTDLLDGALSRMKHQVTKIGKVMDSFSDYLVLGVISIAFVVYRLIPWWFLAAIVVRSAVMIVGMHMLTRRRGFLKPDTSFIGKASIFAIMVLYAFEVFALLAAPLRWTQEVAAVLEYVVGAFLVVSIVDKLVYFTTQMREVSKK